MRPLVFNVDKPVGMTSYDVIRYFKKNLPQKFGKIGHFGTLDPFCSGVLMIGVAGAGRLNDYIHQFYTKTYLATGELGVHTDTGDMTSPITQKEDNSALMEKLATLDVPTLQEIFRPRFAGEYWQAPPAYSAAKFQGKSLHEWAREGVMVEKGPKKRFVYSLDVLSFNFPFLTLRVKVSSGTYIRTLFQDCAKSLGTIGTLHHLKREWVGHIDCARALKREEWPIMGKTASGEPWGPETYGLPLDYVFPLPQVYLPERESQYFSQGRKISLDAHSSFKLTPNPVSELSQDPLPNDKIWVFSPEGKVLGMGRKEDGNCIPLMNFP